MKPVAAVASTVVVKADLMRLETAMTCSSVVGGAVTLGRRSADVRSRSAASPGVRDDLAHVPSRRSAMTNPSLPSVSVRGEAVLVVEPEIADLGVTVRSVPVTGRPRWSGAARCRSR